ncbi:M23 family metallopeptidase [Streptomyces sp. NPDC004111]|uniref:M23 family metallopeptidase n=1 Tax=Streptomyces sp. NPDC004111 TaxID=3364690 RepID=UPI0036B1575F
MNDQQPHAGYDTYPTGSFETDPLFGGLPHAGTGGHSGQYDTTQWDTGSQQHLGYDAYGAHTQHLQDQGHDGTGSWSRLGGHPTGADIPAQTAYTADSMATGQWDATAWNQADQIHQAHQSPFETGQFDAGQFGYPADASSGHQWQPYGASPETGSFDTGAFTSGSSSFDTGSFETTGSYGTGSFETGSFETGSFEAGAFETAAFDTSSFEPSAFDSGNVGTGDFDATAWNTEATATEPEPAGAHDEFPHQAEDSAGNPFDGHHDDEAVHSTAEFPAVTLDPDHAHSPGHPRSHGGDGSGPGPEPELAAVGPRAARRAPANRGRRRTPAKRSALLTVAVPSACVMGVAGIAAASVGGVAGADEAKTKPMPMAAADPTTVKPVAVNNKLDTQLAGLSADARDFGDRASRTQERIDLKERQDAEKKRKAEEAARKEAARPKYALPVAQHGLSAYYGQAGVNWAAVHTGIDFPVDYGTPVMAATDGEVSAEYNVAYGNMMKVVSPKGVETWYCHLGSTKVRSGSVKAGDVIGYSGSSGNSTGPHLHFEVRPGGESAVDPLAWFRSHGLDPT